MTYLMMRLEWKGFISSKPCRLIVVPRQEFIKHMFGKLLFFFVFPKLGISYKVKKVYRAEAVPPSRYTLNFSSLWTPFPLCLRFFIHIFTTVLIFPSVSTKIYRSTFRTLCSFFIIVVYQTLKPLDIWISMS